MLRAEGIGVEADDTRLLGDISATFAPGRITAIVGPNGAGKSTLLACLAGLITPAQGTVLLKDAPLGGLGATARARCIGYLPQDASLHWNISVRALVALGRYPYGDVASAAGQAAIDQALDEAGLAGLADRLAGTLSGGERARALLARVLAGQPRWILADEPLAALDLAHRGTLMERLRAAAARGVGVVIVAHDLGLVARAADDALLLSGGRLIAAGPVAEILTPAHLAPVFDVNFTYALMDDGQRVLVSREGA